MNERRHLILGADGQLGKALQLKYPEANIASSAQLDITDQTAVEAYDWSAVDVVFNCAAYTDVDSAETTEGRIAAWEVNAVAVGNLGRVATKHNLTLVHFSSDYVFDGTINPHTEDEVLSPLSFYGTCKAAGELLIRDLEKYYLLRTSWVIGEGKNFVRTMLELGAKGIDPTVVSDQIGRLTFTSQLVAAIDHLLQIKASYGIYNVTNDGEPASWAEIARLTFAAADMKNNLIDTTTESYFATKPHIAPRPANSTYDLSKIKATGLVLTDWREELERYVKMEMST